MAAPVEAEAQDVDVGLILLEDTEVLRTGNIAEPRAAAAVQMEDKSVIVEGQKISGCTKEAKVSCMS